MPKCFEIYGYIVFFWSNESDPIEPVHVHVGKQISSNCTKIWILSDGSTEVENNNSRIPSRDLNRILATIEAYSYYIVDKWERYFGVKAVYKDLR
jgi:hypothetical protein